MSENTKITPDNTVTDKHFTIEKARVYEQKRFTRSGRMRRLDRFEKEFAQQVFDLVGTDAKILDVPCGNGRFFNTFSQASQLYMGDYSDNMLKSVEERFDLPETVKLIQADISAIPLDDNSVDLCFCMRLFHHMKNDEVRLNALKDLARVAKKYVAFSFYNKNSMRYYYRKILGKKIRGNYVTYKHIVALAEQVGLKPFQRYPAINLTEQQCLVIFTKV